MVLLLMRRGGLAWMWPEHGLQAGGFCREMWQCARSRRRRYQSWSLITGCLGRWQDHLAIPGGVFLFGVTLWNIAFSALDRALPLCLVLV